MKYIDLSKLEVSPSSAITEVVAIDSDNNIIKADFENYATQEELSNLNDELNNAISEVENKSNDAITNIRYTGYSMNGQIIYSKGNGEEITLYLTTVNSDKAGLMSTFQLDDLDNSIYKFSTTSDREKVYLTGYKNDGSQTTAPLPYVTSQTAGILRAVDYNSLTSMEGFQFLQLTDRYNINSYCYGGAYKIGYDFNNADVRNQLPNDVEPMGEGYLIIGYSGNDNTHTDNSTQYLFINGSIYTRYIEWDYIRYEGSFEGVRWNKIGTQYYDNKFPNVEVLPNGTCDIWFFSDYNFETSSGLTQTDFINFLQPIVNSNDETRIIINKYMGTYTIECYAYVTIGLKLYKKAFYDGNSFYVIDEKTFN